MTRQDMQRVLNEHPELTTLGFGTFRKPGMAPARQAARFEKDRYELLNSTPACTAICRWLEKQPKIKSINHQISSYGLKHVAERQSDT